MILKLLLAFIFLFCNLPLQAALTVQNGGTAFNNVRKMSFTNFTISGNSANGNVTLFSNANGDFAGPSSSIANGIVLFDGTTGKRGKDLGIQLRTPVASSMYLGNGAGLAALVDGTSNTALGALAGRDLTTGDFNVFIGNEAGRENTTTNGNVAIGYSTFDDCNNCSNNIAIGQSVMTSNSLSGANQNVFIGTSVGTAITTADLNVGIGYLAFDAHTGGASNVAIGAGSMGSDTTGTENTAIGRDTLAGVTTAGDFNIAIGSTSMFGITGDSNSNIAIGRQSLDGTGVDSNNIAIGDSTLAASGNKSNNIVIGHQAGDAITTGSTNIVIGYDIDPSSNTASNQLYIGNLIYGNGLTATGTTVSTGKVGLGNINPNERLTVNGSISLSQLGSAPANITGYGKVYNNGDSLFFKTAANAEYELSRRRQATVVIDGGGSAITTGDQKNYFRIPAGTTFTDWDIYADQSGSIVVDICCDTYANFPPTCAADTIAASEKPTLSTAQKNQDTSITWTVQPSGNVCTSSVDSATTVTKIQINIGYRKK